MIAEDTRTPVQRRADWVREVYLKDHRVFAQEDWVHAQRIQRNHGNWKAYCVCGWLGVRRHEDKDHAVGSAQRHLKAAISASVPRPRSPREINAIGQPPELQKLYSQVMDEHVAYNKTRPVSEWASIHEVFDRMYAEGWRSPTELFEEGRITEEEWRWCRRAHIAEVRRNYHALGAKAAPSLRQKWLEWLALDEEDVWVNDADHRVIDNDIWES
jgi:hypothetical protein